MKIVCLGNNSHGNCYYVKFDSGEQHKNGTEDLKKAQVYLAWAIERRETDEL